MFDGCPDVPANHWIYEDLAFLNKWHMLGTTHPFRLFRTGRPAPNYEIAIAVGDSVKVVNKAVGDLTLHSPNDGSLPAKPILKKCVTLLRDLVSHFGRYLDGEATDHDGTVAKKSDLVKELRRDSKLLGS
jgi:hypothetical protein